MTLTTCPPLVSLIYWRYIIVGIYLFSGECYYMQKFSGDLLELCNLSFIELVMFLCILHSLQKVLLKWHFFFSFFFLHVRTKGGRKIQTSDLCFIRRDPDWLNYLLRTLLLFILKIKKRLFSICFLSTF